jgi:hypothetical protein
METKQAPRKKVIGKPKRPLSAYNLFFQHERRLMVHEALAESSNDEMITQDMIDDALKTGRRKPPNHRTHGKVPFKDLTSRVSMKWRALSKDEKAVFEEKANVDIKRYQNEVIEWRKEREAKMAQHIDQTDHDEEEAFVSSSSSSSVVRSQDEQHSPAPTALMNVPSSPAFPSISDADTMLQDDADMPSQMNAASTTEEPPPFVQDHQNQVEGSIGVSQTAHLLSNLDNLASTLDDDCLNMLSNLSK